MDIKKSLGDQLIKLGVNIQSKKLNRLQNKQIQVLVDEISTRRHIWAKEIQDWQVGREGFRHEYLPTTFDLQDVYHDVMLDDQLTTVTEDRKLRQQNKDLIVVNKAGEEIEDKTKMLNDQEWLFDLIGQALDSIWYGYTLTHLRTARSATGKIIIKEPYVIPRGFVSPHFNLILKSEYTPNEGVDWDKFPNELLYTSPPRS